eukprot:UN08460
MQDNMVMEFLHDILDGPDQNIVNVIHQNVFLPIDQRPQIPCVALFICNTTIFT